MIKNQKSKHQLTDEEYEAWLEYLRVECYACATQRHSCSHDASDDAPRSEEFEQ